MKFLYVLIVFILTSTQVGVTTMMVAIFPSENCYKCKEMYLVSIIIIKGFLLSQSINQL